MRDMANVHSLCMAKKQLENSNSVIYVTEILRYSFNHTNTRALHTLIA